MKFCKIQDRRFNKADRNCKIQFDLHETRYYGVFRVADIELEAQVKKFKMANPIWPTQIAKYNLIYMNLGIWEFFNC